MKLIEDIFNLYRDRFTGNDDDVMTVVMGILQEQNKEAMIDWISDMQESEIYQMLGLYLMEMLRIKLLEEGIEAPQSTDKSPWYH
ncbi:DUF6154 family protein [Aneurinibacillus sp. Ricciae_BoGa-3]|uniref:DUF6154 family protein n=1 Tax=Aneurinibacillus sp. Ricciae_BoGa-3 TaxID=3022697 RepID=UPI00233FD9AE|nr:DUF6154 family protein [Aneurinibacillus sp. Ricciae_BoGa-3]WCK53939.1 DUF6154 family protein [Aneurinibacillus sp. Ricciae_BoGa-3]